MDVTEKKIVNSSTGETSEVGKTSELEREDGINMGNETKKEINVDNTVQNKEDSGNDTSDKHETDVQSVNVNDNVERDGVMKDSTQNNGATSAEKNLNTNSYAKVVRKDEIPNN